MLVFFLTYGHHVGGYYMRFICGWNAKLRDSKCGPKVQVTELKSHGYLVAFFMAESDEREPTFQRCWP